MINYYWTERYPFWLIHDFVSGQRNLSEILTLTDYEMEEKEG